MGRYQKFIYRNLSSLSAETRNNLEQLLAAEYPGRYSIEKSDFSVTVKINTTNAKWLSLLQRAEEMTHGEHGRYVWVKETRESKIWIPEDSDKEACRKAVQMAREGDLAFAESRQYEVRMSDNESWIPEDCIDFYVH